MNPRILGPLRITFLLFLLFVFFPGSSSSQGIFQGFSGNFDLNYSFFSSKTKLASGETIKTETNTYNPRFTLNLNTNIFPNLKLDAGALFEGTLTKTRIEGTNNEVTTMNMRPYINLTLNNPLYKASVGYYRRQETVDPEDGEKVTLINDDYIATLDWRPEGLPTFETQFIRRNTYDKDELIQDATQDSAILTSRYAYKGLDLRYVGTYNNQKNHLVDLETRTLTHFGRIVYSDSFLDRRINFYTTYEINRQETKISAEDTGGEVDFQVFPISGLSSLDSTPLDGPLLSNPALIDGNLVVSAGINIGLPPIGGDSSGRNIGLDFFVPTEVNKILVWVDRELPSDIANSFSWNIYTSSDNLNWAFHATASPAPFGPFQNRFEIKFSGATARYVKVVTNPLSAIIPGSSAFPNIFITEIQAFARKPVAEVRNQKITQTTHNYNLDVRSRILNIPTLYHELNYIYFRQEPDGKLRYTLSNALSVDHRFSPILAGRGRVAFEYGEEEKEKRKAYLYNASLNATPLRTLRNSLVVSGLFEDIGGNSNNNNSIFLYNTAELYKGLDVSLDGGYSFSNRDTGEKIKDARVSLVTTIIPHPTMNMTFDYSYTNTRQSGGDRPGSSSYTQRGDFTVTYNPLRTLFLVASIELTAAKGEDTIITQEYGLNWSPFPDGALRFQISYNENYRTEDRLKERIFTPSIRYDITKRSYIDFSYQLLRSKSNTQTTESNLFSTSLKIFF
jgi:hypothetical protein